MKIKSHPNEHEGIGPLFDNLSSSNPVMQDKTIGSIGEANRDDKTFKKWPEEEFDYFDGSTYEPKFDATRLRGEMARVYQCLAGFLTHEEGKGWVRLPGQWRTLREISDLTGDPEASISARLRDLRKAKFGAHTVNRRRRGDPTKGVFEYQLL